MAVRKESGRIFHFNHNMDRMCYPPEKIEGGEYRLDPIRNDILDASIARKSFFTGSYRKNPAVYNILAAKFAAGPAEYAIREESGEHFVLGPGACSEILRDCPAKEFSRIIDFLDLLKQGEIKENLLAIYFLGIDESDENRQAFVLVGEDAVFVRDFSLAMSRYPLEEVVFSDEGLSLKNSELAVDWSFDQSLLDYMREIFFLKNSWPAAVPVRHPLLALCSQDGRRDSKYVNGCMDFFLMAAGENLDVHSLLRLESLAALLGLGEDEFLQKLIVSSKRKYGRNEILKQLGDILHKIGPSFHAVFFLCVAEICAASSSPRRTEILDILKRGKFAGREFINSALEYFEHYRKARDILEDMLRMSPGERKKLVSLRQYGQCVDLELLNMGVKKHV